MHRSIITLITILALTGCYNLTGENLAQATKEAKAYAARATKAGADVKFVDCAAHDTDGDGYQACNFLVNGQPTTLDCASKAILVQNHGCKVYVAKMRGNVQGSSSP